MVSFFVWYITISYLVGFVLWAYEVTRMVKENNYHLFGFGIVLLFLAPLTTWHGLLHYLAVWWHRVNGTPFKPWI